MNRIYVFILFLTVSVIASSQKRLFEKAISDGVMSNGFYLLRNKGGKMLRRNSVSKYAEQKGYILGDWTTKKILRFFEYDETISTLEFLPKSDYESYIYSRFSKDTYTLPNPPVKCSAFIYSTDNNLRLVDVANWSGKIKDGKADGYGALVAHSGNDALFVKGTFNNGFPVGKITMTTYKNYGQYKKYNQSNVSKEIIIRVGEFNDGLAYLYSNGKYGFVNTRGNLIIKNEIDSIVSEFHDGQAVVIKNQEEYIINKMGNMIDYTENQKQIFASDSYLNKAYNLISSNAETALDMLNKSYSHGNLKACFCLGEYYSNGYNRLNYSEAVKWYKIAADNGIVEALYELGNIYSNYSFEDRNKETAFQWYLKAAQQGNTKSQKIVAECYENGDGVEQSWVEAFSWYRTVAGSGDSAAELKVGLMYIYGLGVDFDDNVAFQWLIQSYNHGNHYAKDLINELNKADRTYMVPRLSGYW